MTNVSATAQSKPTGGWYSLLEREPYRFDFFQAVRLLNWTTSRDPDSAAPRPTGFDFPPRREVVRFHAHASHGFPQGAITRFESAIDEGMAEMTVSFMGLTGPNGVLPRHYTQLVIDRLREKDRALADYLDLFNHRQISHFFRAWAKYRLPIIYEDAYREQRNDEADVFTRSLFSLAGLGTGGLRNRMDVSDKAFLYFAGHFAHAPRNAISLQRSVGEFFGMTTRIEQFVGQWLYLDETEQSRFGTAPLRVSLNNQLGVDVVVGRRVWGVENKFRVVLGTLSYEKFLEFTPSGTLLKPLTQFVRMYVGPQFDFEVQLILDRREVPACQLSASSTQGGRLGWNTWVFNTPFEDDVRDAVFVADGEPNEAA